jgi:glyoxylase-like metal-dependent hydrolase (beta-lactamase superfamily II)
MNPEFQLVSPQLAIWHAFDRSVKADLFSTALSTGQGTYLIDPIALDPSEMVQLQNQSQIRGIIVTNQNHWRASGQLASQLSIPIFAQKAARVGEESQSFTPLTGQEQLAENLDVIAVDGAVPGEIAIFCQVDGGTLIVGDALINFEPYGFTFLPPKYCSDHQKMRESLRQLADRKVKRIFFAHGFPILSSAVTRLRALLDLE